jgi:uncharacterized protein YjbI with pentapeptide repeats
VFDDDRISLSEDSDGSQYSENSEDLDENFSSSSESSEVDFENVDLENVDLENVDHGNSEGEKEVFD